MTASRKAGWWVVCDAYQLGPFKTSAHALDQLARVEALGACAEAHRVEQVVIR